MNKQNGTQLAIDNVYQKITQLEQGLESSLEDFAVQIDPTFMRVFNKDLTAVQKMDVKSLLKTARIHSIAELEEQVQMPVYQNSLKALANGLGLDLDQAKEFLVTYGRFFRVRRFASVETFMDEQVS